ISSPNTPGLRDLQFGDALFDLLQAVKNEQLDLQAQQDKYVPVFVKIAPDMDEVAVQQVAETLLRSKMDGVIATNTTLDKSSVQHLKYGNEMGGLSGLPVQQKSTEIIRQFRAALGPQMPIIGVGGIDSAKAAKDKMDAGANLIQVYSNFIYKGPSLIKEIVESLK
ncbi:MAG: dihydroorotate dehydrogenase (quinone), partial [Pararheinheimera sp.]|nr:dihydroorotate dehydrogenase (quinone) [Rheinheimera sp.]